MCDPYVRESFLTAIPQSSRRDIQPCIVIKVDEKCKDLLDRCVVVASGTGEPTEESAGQAPKLLTVAMSV